MPPPSPCKIFQPRKLTSGASSHADSEISTESDFDASAETLADRLYALRDIVPATTRGWVHARYQTASRWLRTGLAFTGRATWTICVSALLVGIPFALLWAEEQNLIALEQEQRMRELGGELLTAGPGAGDKKEGDDTAAQVGAVLGGDGGGASVAAKPAL